MAQAGTNQQRFGGIDLIAEQDHLSEMANAQSGQVQQSQQGDQQQADRQEQVGKRDTQPRQSN